MTKSKRPSKACAIDAKARGVSSLISNHYVDFTKALYQHADKIDVTQVQLNSSCKGHVRNKIDEVLALYSS